jgi:hypothetical protein
MERIVVRDRSYRIRRPVVFTFTDILARNFIPVAIPGHILSLNAAERDVTVGVLHQGSVRPLDDLVAGRHPTVVVAEHLGGTTASGRDHRGRRRRDVSVTPSTTSVNPGSGSGFGPHARVSIPTADPVHIARVSIDQGLVPFINAGEYALAKFFTGKADGSGSDQPSIHHVVNAGGNVSAGIHPIFDELKLIRIDAAYA